MKPTISERIANDPAFRALFNAGRRRNLARDQVVLAAGTKPETLYLILSGHVAVESVDASGQELLLAYMFPGDFFGEMGLFADVGARSAGVRARSECLLLELSYARFLELAQQHSSLWLELAGQLAARLRVVNRRLATMQNLHVPDRVWLVLSELAERSDAPRAAQGSVVRVTREELGKLAGCSRDVVGIALRDFEQQGRLIRQGHRLIICDSPTPAPGSARVGSD
ncbi:MAG: cyclic nucleotide-binding domain-containing protein [Panacagrimonas sp.]